MAILPLHHVVRIAGLEPARLSQRLSAFDVYQFQHIRMVWVVRIELT